MSLPYIIKKKKKKQGAKQYIVCYFFIKVKKKLGTYIHIHWQHHK